MTEAEDDLRLKRKRSQMKAHNKENMQVSRSVRKRYNVKELGLDRDSDIEVSSSETEDESLKRKKSTSYKKSRTGKYRQIILLLPRESFVIMKVSHLFNRFKNMVRKSPYGCVCVRACAGACLRVHLPAYT